MSLENDNQQLLQERKEQRLAYMEKEEEQFTLHRDQKIDEYYEKKYVIDDVLQNGWPVEGPQIEGAAQLAYMPTTYSERKTIKKHKKKINKAIEKREDLLYSREQLRRSRREQAHRERNSERLEQVSEEELAVRNKDSEEMLRKEKEYLKEKLQNIEMKESILSGEALTEQEKLQVRLDCQKERVKAAAKYAGLMPVGSQYRAEALAVKEKEEIKANAIEKQLKIQKMPDGPEKENAQSTVSRHARFDFLKGILRKENPLSYEETAYRSPQGDLFVNKGRAFFGGTKPMYIFEKEGGERYLYKEAINCVGISKPQGALVTEAASVLQRRICGEAHSIPAEAVEIDGKIVGSLQKQIQKWRPGDDGEDPPPDLFHWQQNPDDTLNVDTPEMEEIRARLLREHALDWLLCNFDTKGENFLFDRERNLISYDKEASFSHLHDQGAQNMSYTYKPHSNDTIYNVIFRLYAQGDQKLDLTRTAAYIQQIEAMDDEEYLQPFERMLVNKYGENTQKYQENRQKILARKQQIREKYTDFYRRLIQERRENLRKAGKPDDTAGLLDEEGNVTFLMRRP